MRGRRAFIFVSSALVAIACLAAPVRAVAADASTTDPLRSAECRDALDALARREAASTAAAQPSGARSPDSALQASRTRAAHVCLASRADPPVPQRMAQPPLAVPSVTVARPALPVAIPGTPSPAIGPRPAEPPRFTLVCDPLGCWANDGTRLNRVGPDLWGSRGACSVQGTLLQCP